MIKDLFVTRTDKRGVIIASNANFQRISGYTWDEMANAPHKIVRHPDVPKAIFHIVWETLKKGEPVGVYVKNKIKDGKHYWVFATMLPVDDGYISIRFLLDDFETKDIAEVYAKICAKEAEDGLSPEDSAKALEAELQSKGYSDYAEFMMRHAGQQLVAAQPHTDRPGTSRVLTVNALLSDWDDAAKVCDDIIQEYEAFLPTVQNVRILASRLGQQGRALATIAVNFGDLAGQIRHYQGTLSKSIANLSGSLRRSLFKLCLSDLVEEARKTLADGTAFGAVSAEHDDALAAISIHYQNEAEDVIRQTAAESEDFESHLSHMRRYLSALGMTRVMSAVEQALSSGQDSASIGAIVEKLQYFQDFTGKGIDDVSSRRAKVQLALSQLVSVNDAGKHMARSYAAKGSHGHVGTGEQANLGMA